jgi:hypothetical protein
VLGDVPYSVQRTTTIKSPSLSGIATKNDISTQKNFSYNLTEQAERSLAEKFVILLLPFDRISETS